MIAITIIKLKHILMLQLTSLELFIKKLFAWLSNYSVLSQLTTLTGPEARRRLKETILRTRITNYLMNIPPASSPLPGYGTIPYWSHPPHCRSYPKLPCQLWNFNELLPEWEGFHQYMVLSRGILVGGSWEQLWEATLWEAARHHFRRATWWEAAGCHFRKQLGGRQLRTTSVGNFVRGSWKPLW